MNTAGLVGRGRAKRLLPAGCLALLGGLGIMLSASGTSRAEPITYEGFDYAVGDLVGRNGGTGWGGAWRDGAGTRTVASQSLAYSAGGADLLTSGNRAVVGVETFANVVRNFSQSFGTDGTTIWMSVLVRGSKFASGFQLANGSDTGDGSYKLLASAANGVWQTRVGTTNQSTTVAVNQVSLALLRITFQPGNDAIDLWLNPPSLVSEAALGSPTNTRTGNFTFDRIRLNGGQNATGTVDAEFDEIRLGTSFPSVVVVPEPGTAILGLFALAVLAARGRSRDQCSWPARSRLRPARPCR